METQTELSLWVDSLDLKKSQKQSLLNILYEEEYRLNDLIELTDYEIEEEILNALDGFKKGPKIRIRKAIKNLHRRYQSLESPESPELLQLSENSIFTNCSSQENIQSKQEIPGQNTIDHKEKSQNNNFNISSHQQGSTFYDKEISEWTTNDVIDWCYHILFEEHEIKKSSFEKFKQCIIDLNIAGNEILDPSNNFWKHQVLKSAEITLGIKQKIKKSVLKLRKEGIYYLKKKNSDISYDDNLSLLSNDKHQHQHQFQSQLQHQHQHQHQFELQPSTSPPLDIDSAPVKWYWYDDTRDFPMFIPYESIVSKIIQNAYKKQLPQVSLNDGKFFGQNPACYIARFGYNSETCHFQVNIDTNEQRVIVPQTHEIIQSNLEMVSEFTQEY